MSVQRYSAYHSGDPSQIGLWPDPEGYWLPYADHARIVQEMEQAHAAALAENSELWKRLDATHEAQAAALEVAHERGMRTTGHYRVAHEQGKADERAAIRARVVAEFPHAERILAAIDGPVVNDAPTMAPAGCAHCGHSRARHYLTGDRCANDSCGCIYPSRAVVSDAAATPLPPMPSEVLGPVDIRDYLGMPPVQGHFTGGLITDKNRGGSRFVPRGEATP